MKRCTKCRRLIKFIQMLSGKYEPCDPAMVRPDGNRLLVFSDGTVGRTHARLDFGFISHFATCPHAKSFKRKKAKAHDRSSRGKKTSPDSGKLFE